MKYIDRDKIFESTLGVDENEVILGNEVAPDIFEADLKLTKWGHEDFLSFALEGVNGKPALFNEKVILVNDKLDIELYKEDTNHFKWIWVLKNKPDTNVLTLKLTGWENFNFWYQDQLTQKEVNEGCERPPDVVGSYAVYHKNKKDNQYKTGKAWHIYRPKFIDAANNWEWGVLKIKDGIYTVTVSQEFLDSAVYPIRVNDNFGETSIGGSSFTLDFLFGRFTAFDSGHVTSMRFYVENTSSSPRSLEIGYYKYKVPLWNIGDHVAHGTSGLTPPFSQGWATADVVGYITNGDQYWLGRHEYLAQWPRFLHL